MRHLTGPLGVTDLAINYYELKPGDSFAFASHDHETQEEVFYIQSGTATFETEDGGGRHKRTSSSDPTGRSSDEGGIAGRNGWSIWRSEPRWTTGDK